MQSDLSSQTVTWTDSAGRDLDRGHFKVDPEHRLMLKGAQVTDAGMYVCTVSKVSSSDEVTVIRHVVNLNGIALSVYTQKNDHHIHFSVLFKFLPPLGGIAIHRVCLSVCLLAR